MKRIFFLAVIISLCNLMPTISQASEIAESATEGTIVESHSFSTGDLIVYPGEDRILLPGELYDINVSLPDYIKGKLIINEPFVSKNGLAVTLQRVENNDFPDNREDVDDGELSNANSHPVEYANVYDTSKTVVDDGISNVAMHSGGNILIVNAIIDNSGRICNFPIDFELPDGKWCLCIPDGFFEVQPETVEVDEMPFTAEEFCALDIPGAWHKAGEKWEGRPMFSIHDDDGVDFKIKASGAPYPIPNRYGYFTMLYPLLESLGLRGCLSVEGWRVGMTDNPPAPNDNGKIMLRLQNERGWELMAHSMEVFGGGVYNNWYVESLDSDLADQILASAVNKGWSSNTETVYDAETEKQYFPNSDNTAWVEAPRNFIKQYAYEYGTKTPVLYDDNHNVGYHWGEWFRLAENFGFKSKAWVQHNAITSHAYATEILKYGPYGFSDMEPPYQYNLPMMRSTATRMMMEGQSAPGYIGESSDNNLADPVQLEWFKNYIDQCVADGGWMVMGLHMYRKCWVNYIPGALVSEGGDYPDEWVDPLHDMDFINDPLTPPASLGIADWSEWYPCPGTRLDMMREILLYCKEKGMINVTSTEGFEAMGNRKMAGYYNGGVRIGCDRSRMEGDRDSYPHYVESATGEESYYNPLITTEISRSYSIASRDISTSVDSVADSGLSGVRYYDLQGNQLNASHLDKRVCIRVDSNGARKIIR